MRLDVSVDFLYAKVKELHDDQPKFNFWLKDDVPNHLYYKNTPRIGPIVITEHLGYSIASHGETAGTDTYVDVCFLFITLQLYFFCCSAFTRSKR